MAVPDVAERQAVTCVRYGREIEAEISRLAAAIEAAPAVAAAYPPRWLAIQLLEGDETLLAEVRAADRGPEVLAVWEESLARLRAHVGPDVDVAIAEARYNFIHGLVGSVMTRTRGERLTVSDRIDRIVTHRLLGIPIFLGLMWALFKLTTDVSAPYLDWVAAVIGGPLTRWTGALLDLSGLGHTWLKSLAVDGIIAGVGGVLVFVPVLMSLYLGLALLEDSGYMARAAFVMDRLMNRLGLHGKSFLPMIVGFGCNVPAIYATRTLENEKDRLLTGLLVPFMSCGARLPVYILFAAVFFPNHSGLVVFSMYLIGITTAVVLGLLFKRTLFKDQEPMPLVMELPPYRLPTLRGIWFHVWERTSSFIHNASTIILAASILLWILLSIPVRGGSAFADTPVRDSAFATVSQAIAPALAPAGFDSWEASGALMTGLVAKEVVISTLAQVYNVAEEAEAQTEPPTFVRDVGQIAAGFAGATLDTLKSIPLIVGIDLFAEEEAGTSTVLMGALRTGFEASSGGHGALASLAFMVFVLLYTPCMATIAAERQILGARWMWFSVAGQLSLAWLAATIVFQTGLLLRLG